MGVVKRFTKNVNTLLYLFIFMSILIGVLSGFLTYSIVKVEGDNAYYVSGKSMEPTFENGDLVKIVDESEYDAGQIIVFQKPKDWTHAKTPSESIFIKRIGATEGDTLKYKGRHLYVNGKKTYEIPETMRCDLENGWEYTVPKNELFVVGDNAPESADSRFLLCATQYDRAMISENLVKTHGNDFFKEN